MWNYFQLLCEEEMARLERHKDLSTKVQLSQKGLIEAMGADNRHKDLTGTHVQSRVGDLGDWAIIGD